MRFIFLILISILILDANTDSKESYERGKILYMSKGCTGCHGVKAEGMHNYPGLANRAKGYLAYKLKRFRDKKADTQQQEMMIAYSIGLSDQDIEDLTTFFTDYAEDELSESYNPSYGNEGDGGS